MASGSLMPPYIRWRIYISQLFSIPCRRCCNHLRGYDLRLHWPSQQALPSARLPFRVYLPCPPAPKLADGISSWRHRFP